MLGMLRLERLFGDIGYALRTLRNNPGLTSVAVLTLALGIGANTAIFSLIDTLLLRSLPVPNPQECGTSFVCCRTTVGPKREHAEAIGSSSTQRKSAASPCLVSEMTTWHQEP